MGSPRADGPEVGVVIPAIDEEEALPALLDDLSTLALLSRVVVVDGGSSDATVQAARAGGALVMRSRPGRARQMNAGAAFLNSPWLLFVHADSRLSREARDAVESHVQRHRADPDIAPAAFFGLTIDHPHFFYRLIERGQRLREERLGLTYGDQGLLVRRDAFLRIGPYPDEPIMEDVTLTRRLRDAGKLTRLPAEIASSARRYEEEGRVRAWVRNAWLISQFLAGADPAELAAAYPTRRCRAQGRTPPSARRPQAIARRSRAVLLVFAKAPRPGSVKTRLARALGPETAAAAYRRMGRLIVDQLTSAPAEMVVCFDPPDAEDELRRWLDPARSDSGGPLPERRYVPQGGGDLGARMARMFDLAFDGGGPVVIVGTDAPAVDASSVERAIDALETADLVLGPSSDGGYYLMALREPCPELFRSIPWSTSGVLRKTAERARRMGMEATYLEVESDIDTADDLTPELARRLGLVLTSAARPRAGYSPRVRCRPCS